MKQISRTKSDSLYGKVSLFRIEFNKIIQKETEYGSVLINKYYSVLEAKQDAELLYNYQFAKETVAELAKNFPQSFVGLFVKIVNNEEKKCTHLYSVEEVTSNRAYLVRGWITSWERRVEIKTEIMSAREIVNLFTAESRLKSYKVENVFILSKVEYDKEVEELKKLL